MRSIVFPTSKMPSVSKEVFTSIIFRLYINLSGIQKDIYRNLHNYYKSNLKNIQIENTSSNVE